MIFSFNSDIIGYKRQGGNDLFKKIKSILNNYYKGENHWSYSFSLALFIVGALIFALATIENSSGITILSSIVIVFGIFSYPNFKSSYIDNFAKGMLKFSVSTLGITTDIILFRQIIKNIHKHSIVLFLYFIALSTLTFFIARYYIDVMYHVIYTIIKGAKGKSEIIKRFWKIVLALVAFFVSLATLTSLVINIINMITK